MKLRITIVIIALITGVSALAQDVTTDSVEAYAETKQVVEELNRSILVGYAPSISADGKTMIFEAKDDTLGGFKLLESRMGEDGKWQDPVPIDSINSFGESNDLIGGPSISFDGNTLYFFASIGLRASNEIYYSTRELGGWSRPKSIGAPINTPLDESFPSISADGKTLFFVRINEDGPKDKEMRKKDLYCTSIFKTVRNEDGSWTDPIKLSAPINQDCEKAPKIMADGKTLLFSSNRAGGKGGYDMYQSKLNILGEWGFAVPLNYVNTPKDDQLPSISASGDLMYYVYDNKDIYTVEIPPHLRQFKNNVITGKITDRDTNEGLAAKVIVTNAFTSEEIMALDNNPNDGSYSVVVPVGDSYNILVQSEGYSSHAAYYDLREVDEYRETDQDISLFKSVKLDLNISDRELFEPVPAEIVVSASNGAEIIRTTADSRTGRAELDLPLGDKYSVTVAAEFYIEESLDFDVTGLVMYRDFENDIDLAPEKKEVMINVTDLVNNSKVRSKIRLINKDRNEVIEVEGNELVSLRAGDRYEIEATSDQGYAFNSTEIDLDSDEKNSISLQLQKLEKDALLTLKDILFESNSAQLSEVSFTELRRVIKLMKENPTLRVEIAAHTDDVGSAPYNLILSEQRAESVVQFLIDNQISRDRFIAQGYGESVPKVPNDTDENKAVNRRVELRILGV